ncbi:putative endonuclease lcl3 [Coelomomyces lativittatus]|nr:putative endonuclease lcl3 [Coelomomyces lativittatus]KAJ1508848.1 putative endonuclease lcl3 [Coelomomyces lativittatus]KAJ1517875.1 putative endonuclease lcl3 [Coelomomyces lativittatus]
MLPYTFLYHLSPFLYFTEVWQTLSTKADHFQSSLSSFTFLPDYFLSSWHPFFSNSSYLFPFSYPLLTTTTTTSTTPSYTTIITIDENSVLNKYWSMLKHSISSTIPKHPFTEDGSSTSIKKNHPESTTPSSVVGVTVLTVFLFTLYFTKKNNTWFRRFHTTEDIIPSKHLRRPLNLVGYVVSVGDSDGFRFFHTPTFLPLLFHFKPITLASQTLSIRIAGVDCPEASHFGHPAQPYSYESYVFTFSKLIPTHPPPVLVHEHSKKFLKGNTVVPRHPPFSLSWPFTSWLRPWTHFFFSSRKNIHPLSKPKETSLKVLPLVNDHGKKKRKVYIQIYRKDQYARAVAMVYYRPFPSLFPFYWKNLSLELLKHGLATIYNQSGAVYGPYLKQFQLAEEKARKQKLGIWSNEEFMSPGEWKKLNRESSKN